VELWMEYNLFKPFGKFNRGGIGLWQQYGRLYKPNTFTEYGINFWAWAQTKSFWRLNMFSYHEPIAAYDYFEPRTEGRFYRQPSFNFFGVNINSDQRKKLAFGFFGRFGKFNEAGRNRLTFGIAPRYRVSDKLNFRLDVQNTNQNNDVGFVNYLTTDNQTDVIFGIRDRKTLETTFNTNYNFSPTMALTFRLRHYWSRVQYDAFKLLKEDGHLGETDYNDFHDNNFNAFTIDMVYRWRFSPGSDLFVVWKNSIFNSDDFSTINFMDNLNNLWEAPQTNSLSIKFIYYLDYQMLEKRGA